MCGSGKLKFYSKFFTEFKQPGYLDYDIQTYENSVVHKAYRCTVGTVTLKIESVLDKLQLQHVENLYDNKHNIPLCQTDCQ
jgi:uncharacterized linocin/CFP29 family protein